MFAKNLGRFCRIIPFLFLRIEVFHHFRIFLFMVMLSFLHELADCENLLICTHFLICVQTYYKILQKFIYNLYCEHFLVSHTENCGMSEILWSTWHTKKFRSLILILWIPRELTVSDTNEGVSNTSRFIFVSSDSQ